MHLSSRKLAHHLQTSVQPRPQAPKPGPDWPSVVLGLCKLFMAYVRRELGLSNTAAGSAREGGIAPLRFLDSFTAFRPAFFRPSTQTPCQPVSAGYWFHAHTDKTASAMLRAIQGRDSRVAGSFPEHDTDRAYPGAFGMEGPEGREPASPYGN
ncbi:hypothetical protein PG993_009673 [Apiospora rasikravindrae]|uniref:Uncharacterized protein n=1 Tax=Apiospora rasikravindrae TaxID=990691 RepID=A0ABR1SK23_9PEZI